MRIMTQINALSEDCAHLSGDLLLILLQPGSCVCQPTRVFHEGLCLLCNLHNRYQSTIEGCSLPGLPLKDPGLFLVNIVFVFYIKTVFAPEVP